MQLIHATLSPETLPVTVEGTKTVTIPLFFIISSAPHVCVHGGVLISEAAVNGSSRKYSALFLLNAGQHLTCVTSPNLAAKLLVRSAENIKTVSMTNSLLHDLTYSVTLFSAATAVV